MNETYASVDVSTKENLNKLVDIGDTLLKKPVSRVNLETGLSEPIENGGTNEEALRRYMENACIVHSHTRVFLLC